MRQLEQLKVCIRTDHGRTICMCLKSNKRCDRNCGEDITVRDRLRGWQDTMKRGRFGK